MATDVLRKLTAYRLETDSIDGITLPDFQRVDAGSKKIGGASVEYQLWFYNQRPIPASWYPAFSYLGLPRAKVPATMSAGFVLLVRFAGACYAVTGGVGHIHLRKAVEITYQFGIELAKRLLTENELRSLAQRDTGGNVNAMDRHFRGRYSPRGDLGNLRRILKAVRGQLSKAENPLFSVIGSSIQGTDGLSVNGRKSFADILKFLLKVEDVWQSGKDRIIIPSLVRLSPKANSQLIEGLRQALVRSLLRYRPEAPQDLFLDTNDQSLFSGGVSQWTLHAGRKRLVLTSTAEVLSAVRDWLAEAPDHGRMATFERLQLQADFDDGTSDDAPLERYLCGDVVLHNNVYFVDQCMWFHASKGYIKALEGQLNNIECLSSAQLGLNEWKKTTYVDEDAFNASHHQMVLLDRRLVKADGQTGIEFCDLLAIDGPRIFLIHVKEANGAELRELFAQGRVAGVAYSNDAGFRQVVHAADFTSRKSVRALTAKERATLKALANLQVRQMTLVYAILDVTPSHAVASGATTTCEQFDGTLSTFAKVDLLTSCEHLRGLGYQVALTRIRPHPSPGRRKAKR